jgi:hypothetical protein
MGAGPPRAGGLPTLLLLAACHVPGPLEGTVDPALRRDLVLSENQAAYLEDVAAAADAAPNDPELRKASGMAHMRFTLAGALWLRDRAEADLEAAFRLDPGDRELARALGRFYNMRAVERDGSKATEQVEAYRAYLGDVEVEAMTSEAFVAHAFAQLGAILDLRERGRMPAAYRAARELEVQLRRRTAADPDDVELWAVAGNFAFFFAGNIPTKKRHRTREAVRYFTRLRAQWSQLRAEARDPQQCPNTYENFMFQLAEGHLALDERDQARPIYEELTVVREPVTRPKQQIAFVASERLRNLDRYAGRLELMPPWPSDVGNCVVCHTHEGDIPLTTLYTLEPITLDDIPYVVVSPPMTDTAPVPGPVWVVLDRHCTPCHGRGGEAEPFASFVGDAAVSLHRRAIERRVAAEEMPPDTPLPPEDASLLLEWLRTP